MMLARRGIEVSYETIRQWCLKFGQAFANKLRRRRARPGDKWHLDEVVLKIKDKLGYFWRAVDQEGAPVKGLNASEIVSSNLASCG